MTDAENQNSQMTLRPRGRSALSDISNTLAQSISNMTKRVVAPGKKRKLTSDDDTVSLNESQIQTTSSSAEKRPRHSNEDGEMFENPLVGTHSESSAAPAETEVVDVTKGREGFFLPPKINRKLPLFSRGADPSHCLDIIDDMYAFYSETEEIFMAKYYFDNQSEISVRMRTILVDWLVEVHYKYKLNPLTLWLTVNILDRYLEHHDIPRAKLQLVGITSLFLACKFEEIHSPQVADCVYLTDSAYSKEDILAMETSILDALNYQFIVPTPFHFVTRYLNRIKAGERVRLLASYAAERSLQEVEVLQFKPSVYAAAAVYVALRTVNMDSHPGYKVWTEALQEESGLKESDIIDCARRLIARIEEIPQASSRRKLDAAKKKYSSEKTQFIANLTFPSL